jgi:uncharacterized protein YutE (UPF0331/DUF86 family)
VNTQRIKEQLAYLDRCLSISEQMQHQPLSELEEFALARALQIAVECIIDVGSLMIDGFIMRDPGGYLDIIDILEDEQVLSSDLASTLKSWVQLRERLIRYYTEVRQEELLRAVTSVSTVRLFIQSVERYLEKELR